MQGIALIFQLIILLFSVTIHEVSHGAMAYKLGDPTAKDSGRLSLNPLKHLDLFGSFLLPLFLFLVSKGSFVFGWAKPVPFNPLLLRKPKRDIGLVAFAGPAANLSLAIIFGLLLRFFSSFFNPFLNVFFAWIVATNLLLAVFNLVPIPPLDGSKILFSFAPSSWLPFLKFLEVYGWLILLFFLFFGVQFIFPIVSFFFHFLTGLSF